MGGGGGGGRLNLGGGEMGGHNGGVSGGGMGHMGHMGGVATATWVAWPEATSMAAQTGMVETLPTITGTGIGIVTTISITGSLSDRRSSMAAITPTTATATAPGCGGKPSSPEAPIGGRGLTA